MNAKSMVLGLGLLLLSTATGCGGGYRTVREPVPPRMDLRGYGTVGLVGFSSNARGDLDRMSTQRFLRAVQAAQPGTRVIELGSEERVLSSVGRRSWDRETLRRVKEEHGVDAIVIGRLDVERNRPDVHISSFVKQVNVKQDVNAELTARLVETESGATMWTDGAKCTTELANANFDGRGHGHGDFAARDPEATYGQMIDGLVWRVTDAFRVHYITRTIPIETSSGSVARAE